MKNFLVLHYGFEKPSPEEMGAWNKWFESRAFEAELSLAINPKVLAPEPH